MTRRILAQVAGVGEERAETLIVPGAEVVALDEQGSNRPARPAEAGGQPAGLLLINDDAVGTG